MHSLISHISSYKYIYQDMHIYMYIYRYILPQHCTNNVIKNVILLQLCLVCDLISVHIFLKLQLHTVSTDSVTSFIPHDKGLAHSRSPHQWLLLGRLLSDVLTAGWSHNAGSEAAAASDWSPRKVPAEDHRRAAAPQQRSHRRARVNRWGRTSLNKDRPVDPRSILRVVPSGSPAAAGPKISDWRLKGVDLGHSPSQKSSSSPWKVWNFSSLNRTRILISQEISSAGGFLLPPPPPLGRELCRLLVGLSHRVSSFFFCTLQAVGWCKIIDLPSQGMENA